MSSCWHVTGLWKKEAGTWQIQYTFPCNLPKLGLGPFLNMKQILLLCGHCSPQITSLPASVLYCAYQGKVSTWACAPFLILWWNVKVNYLEICLIPRRDFHHVSSWPVRYVCLMWAPSIRRPIWRLDQWPEELILLAFLSEECWCKNQA